MDAEDPGTGHLQGLVMEALGGVYRVCLEDGSEVDASLRGRLKRQERIGDRVVPGDLVHVSEAESQSGCTIEAVLDRRNALVRAGPGGRRAKVVVTNLDRCIVVLSVQEPPFREEIANRFLALTESCGIPPVLVVNKVDLQDPPDAVFKPLALYRDVGYPVLETSVPQDRGLAELAQLISTGVSTLVGPSGVGKSSLLNALDPDLHLRTAPVSQKGARGRHTTVSARLLRFGSNGWVADTPGFSEVSLWRVDRAGLGQAFPEFREPATKCRFRGCSHLHEPDCGVQEALKNGEISPTRYDSYRALWNEHHS